ncbi:MAG: transposase, partial [Planctomycetes bacterium]|nr:transposase [Planctomycetota bacterium]
YANADTIERMEQDGKDLYVAVSRSAGNSQRRYDFRPESVTARAEKNITDPRMLAMKEKLSTEEGKRIYAKRKHTVEPVFGIMKQVMGYRQTLLRGLEKVSGDWGLVCLAYNFKRLFSLQAA